MACGSAFLSFGKFDRKVCHSGHGPPFSAIKSVLSDRACYAVRALTNRTQPNPSLPKVYVLQGGFATFAHLYHATDAGLLADWDPTHWAALWSTGDPFTDFLRKSELREEAHGAVRKGSPEIQPAADPTRVKEPERKKSEGHAESRKESDLGKNAGDDLSLLQA